MSIRNVGSGIAALHGWHLGVGPPSTSSAAPDPSTFHRLTRDLYVAAGDVGFWQGTFRDPSADEFVAARAAIDARQPVTIDVLYGDHEGGQRAITRFTMTSHPEATGWFVSAARHWNVDRSDPRER